jgi:hypothetical protein
MDHVHKILDMEYHKEALLFLLYINDLPLYVEHIMSEVYADDTSRLIPYLPLTLSWMKIWKKYRNGVLVMIWL